MKLELKSRNELLSIMKKLEELSLNKGTSGNCSVRFRDDFLITPSGKAPRSLIPADMVLLSMAGDILCDVGKVPSSEWRFHRDIYLSRPEIKAVVHTHSTYAAALSCQRKDLPAFHYMVAVGGGDSIKCAPYALFGTEKLSVLAIEALTNRKACLLSNHGLIAIGVDLEDALAIAIEVENLCEQYILSTQIGKPILLSKNDMKSVLKSFKNYGRGLNK